MEEFPKCMQVSGNPGNDAQSSSVPPPENAAPRGATFCTSGGSNYIYSIISRQEQENSLDVVTDRTKIINFYVYALLDPKSSLCFVTLYVANQLEIILEKLCELFFVSTPIVDSVMS